MKLPIDNILILTELSAVDAIRCMEKGCFRIYYVDDYVSGEIYEYTSSQPMSELLNASFIMAVRTRKENKYERDCIKKIIIE